MIKGIIHLQPFSNSPQELEDAAAATAARLLRAPKEADDKNAEGALYISVPQLSSPCSLMLGARYSGMYEAWACRDGLDLPGCAVLYLTFCMAAVLKAPCQISALTQSPFCNSSKCPSSLLSLA